MFNAIKNLFQEKLPEPTPLPPAPPSTAVADSSKPDNETHRKAWVMLADGRCAYIHHYKINGKFGVRPVGFESGLHYPNTSEHWTAEQKLQVPEELALTIREFRAATPDEVPPMWRPR